MAGIDDDRDEAFARKRIPGRFYISRSFPYAGVEGRDPLKGKGSRFSYTVMDNQGEAIFASDSGWDLVVRETPTRQQLKAIFFEDTRATPMLTFQRFDVGGKHVHRESFTLREDEIDQLETFLAVIRSPGLVLDENTQDDRLKVTPELARQMLAGESTLYALFREHPDVVAEFLRSDVGAPEIVALAHRKEVIAEFERLLTDSGYFEEARSRTSRGRSEDVWQEFIETNPWVVGSSTAPQFLHSFSAKKLEQTVKGASLAGSGKRPDAVMRTAGAVSALVLVEIKHHQTRLLREEYRSGSWEISREVAGGIAQCQASADETQREFARTIPLRTENGHRQGEVFVCRPRTILIAGALTEFEDDEGNLHYEQFESFERFRRSLRDPEILTFDELFQRARLVVGLVSEQGRPSAG